MPATRDAGVQADWAAWAPRRPGISSGTRDNRAGVICGLGSTDRGQPPWFGPATRDEDRLINQLRRSIDRYQSAEYARTLSKKVFEDAAKVAH